MNVRPFRDYLLVHRCDSNQMADGVIDVAGGPGEDSEQGKVLAVGLGKPPVDGTSAPLAIKVGDTILFGRQPRTEISVDGQAVLVVREDQVLAVLA